MKLINGEEEQSSGSVGAERVGHGRAQSARASRGAGRRGRPARLDGTRGAVGCGWGLRARCVACARGARRRGAGAACGYAVGRERSERRERVALERENRGREN
jgi:hypothetical protein